MSLYLENGYLNFEELQRKSSGTRIWVLGGRGIGKTYNALHWALDQGKPFLYLRRTKDQLDDMTHDYFNPFRVLAPDYIINVASIKKGRGRFYTGDPDDKESQTDRGLMLSLSGIASLRGFDMSGYDVGIFDEAIPEEHEPQRHGEGKALQNAIETINRNREKDGRRKFRMFLLANTNSLDSRILTETRDSDIIERMQRRGQTYYDSRAVTVWNLTDSPISEWKRKNQDLYAGAADDFTRMALDNRFAADVQQIQHADLRQYRGRAVIGSVVLWRSRQDETRYHVTSLQEAPAGSLNGVRTFTDDARGQREVRLAMPFLQLAYTQGRITFTAYSLKAYFENIIY